MKKHGDVLRELGRAFIAGEADKLAALCTEHQDIIRDNFEDWADANDELESADARQVMALVLQVVAEMFADHGIPDLVATLGRKKDDEPVH